VSAPRAEAEASQRAASDPAVSAFVAASAGSGKTRLLTDRLLRLMVGGAAPERILCLTFTKAAAAEMSLRLRRRLGQWVTMPHAALEEELRKLAIVPDAEAMTRARSLFARVLDLPGGMRIGTIHAFCQSLLRRFPLEAELSPHFQLADDRDAEEAMAEAREATLAAVRPRGQSGAPSRLEDATRRLAGLTTLNGFAKLVGELRARRADWRGGPDFGSTLAAARRRLLGVPQSDVPQSGVVRTDRAAIIAAAVRWRDVEAVRDAARTIAVRGGKTSRDAAKRMLRWLEREADQRAATWSDWREAFFTMAGTPRAASQLVNKDLDKASPDLMPLLRAEQDRIAAVEDAARAADVADMSEALLDLASPLLDRYESRKQASGLLEFDDLIHRGTRLLVDPGADWVLYKLDGGLDHLLLDEVQDTAPDQWKIAHSLTQEFFAGLGARPVARTVFAVGDRKQSIFSFQGADVAGFETARNALRQRVAGSGGNWRDTPPLNVSFRSTTPILRLVDAVFADPRAAAGVVPVGEVLTHRADREGQAGGVELWPLTDAPGENAPITWSAPEGYRRVTSASQHLAETLADWVRNQTGGGVMLESKGRPLRPGDVMVLLRHRDRFPWALVRALKARGVPVAGLDRMMLTSQPAVQDLVALADALLLPQDDLNFACFLTSPLGGLDDDDLMALAIGRGERGLWDVLRERHAETPSRSHAWSFFNALLARADFTTPHALFAEALGPMGGRARLLARLGPEAAEPIDELLNAALRYASVHPPSLQGFLRWLRLSGAEVKREAEAAGDQVRILTVHGAKGLQAPLVILPDTTAIPGVRDELFWAGDPATGAQVPIWVPRGEFHCSATRAIQARANASREEEYNRLLYVALTRAEDRLLVCGARPARGQPPDGCWYNLVARGLAHLVNVADGHPTRLESPQAAPREAEPDTARSARPTMMSPFSDHPLGPEPARPTRLAPSRPEGVELGPVPASASPLARVAAGFDHFLRGQLTHALLQYLPDLPEADRRAAARRFLARPAHGLPPAMVARIADEAMAILTHPELADVFGPSGRAEVPLTGVCGDVVVGGLVDRLAVTSERVTVVDFKTNRTRPATVAATPIAYLRQMASYRAILRTIFPGQALRCALVWTREALVTVLPDSLLDPHEPGRSA
jgi:ATP-dependent helicase/nuclease subunit A